MPPTKMSHFLLFFSPVYLNAKLGANVQMARGEVHIVGRFVVSGNGEEPGETLERRMQAN